MKLGLIFIFLNTIGFAQTKAIDQLVYEIRDPKTESAHFRQSLEKIGEYLALDILEELPTEQVQIETLTGEKASHNIAKETPVLITILRAGLPLNAGIQKVFSKANVGFLAMSRDEETLKAKVDYIGIPDVKDKIVIISDTMIATGGSLIDAIQIIEKYAPKQIFIVAAIACEPGIARITQHNPTIKVFAAAIDPALNHKGYIIPGLGDAGDRAYGNKVK